MNQSTKEIIIYSAITVALILAVGGFVLWVHKCQAKGGMFMQLNGCVKIEDGNSKQIDPFD